MIFRGADALGYVGLAIEGTAVGVLAAYKTAHAGAPVLLNCPEQWG
jgi:hypothetical protein